MNYFQIIDAPNLTKRWFLQTPTDAAGRELDPESFRLGCPVDASGPLTISVRRPGPPIDWTFADFAMPVVRKNVGDVLQRMAGSSIALFPATVIGYDGEFYVLNVLTCLKCVDDGRSEMMKWRPEDGRTDKVGQYRQITKLRIDREAVRGSDIFRIDGWRIALIVSDSVKTALEKMRVTGISYLPVTD